VLWCGRIAAADTHWNIVLDDAVAFSMRGSSAIARAEAAAAAEPDVVVQTRGQPPASTPAPPPPAVIDPSTGRVTRPSLPSGRASAAPTWTTCTSVSDAARQYRTGSIGSRHQALVPGRHVQLLVAMPGAAR
jgi:hypothetical protein